jgi:hypothetical protein
MKQQLEMAYQTCRICVRLVCHIAEFWVMPPCTISVCFHMFQGNCRNKIECSFETSVNIFETKSYHNAEESVRAFTIAKVSNHKN